MTRAATALARCAQLWAAVALLSACEDPSTPVEPVWNKQPCAHCAMVLSEPEHAAQLATKGGPRLFFDDVGCLVAHLEQDAAARTGARAWVRRGQGWQDAFAARYQDGARTPMDFGFAPSPTGPHDFAALRRAVAHKLAQGGSP